MSSQSRACSAFLYKEIVKPIFFRFDPETVHNFTISMGKMIGTNPVTKAMTRTVWSYRHPILETKIAALTLPNPIGLSAGFDYNGVLTQVLPDVGFGFHTIGTVTLHPYAGNAYPRLGRFPQSRALLVNKGLKNDGAAAIIKKLERLTFKIPVGISIASTNKAYDSEKEQIADILECFQLFEASNVTHAYYEMNISCPNTFGGEPFTKPDRLNKLLTALDKLKISRPVFVKMPIDQSFSETDEMMKVIQKHAIAGIIIGNLTKDKKNPDVNEEDRKNWIQAKGNLSGKPTWKRSNALIRHLRQKLGKKYVIIGTGGVFSADDAWEKIQSGANAVQLITGMIFEGPQLIGQMNEGLAQQLLAQRRDRGILGE